MGGMTRRRGVRWGLAGTALGALLTAPWTGEAAAATPRFYATPACTADSPYQVDMNVADFPPNDEIHWIIAWNWTNDQGEDDQFVHEAPLDIHTDASGNDQDIMYGIDFEGDRPHRIGGSFYHDRDGNNRYSSGDDFIAHLIMSIDQPCTGAEASPK